MDSQHRHHLKDNDLAHILSNAKDVWNDKNWWTKYGNWVLLALLIISGSFFIKGWAERRIASAQEQIWSDLSMATSPESFDAIANNYQDPTIKALSLLRGADLLQQRASAGKQIISTMQPGATTQPEKTTTDPAVDASNAILRYQEVLSIQDISPLIRLNALLGMASAYEEQHDWSNAKKTYQQIEAEADLPDSEIVVRAKNRLEMLASLQGASTPTLSVPPLLPAPAKQQ